MGLEFEAGLRRFDLDHKHTTSAQSWRLMGLLSVSFTTFNPLDRYGALSIKGRRQHLPRCGTYLAIALMLLAGFDSTANAQPPAACQCIWQGSFSQISGQSDLIVSGTVLAHKGNSMDFAIDRSLLDRAVNGREYSQNIRIWGDNGSECRPTVSTFAIASDWLFALKKITSEPAGGFNPTTPNISYGRKNDYYLSMCGAYWLSARAAFVSGNLVEGPRWQWHNKKMNPVSIDLVEAYVNNKLSPSALLKASQVDPVSKQLMSETLDFIDRSALTEFNPAELHQTGASPPPTALSAG